jgi:hypothetical protein
VIGTSCSNRNQKKQPKFKSRGSFPTGTGLAAI